MWRQLHKLRNSTAWQLHVDALSASLWRWFVHKQTTHTHTPWPPQILLPPETPGRSLAPLAALWWLDWARTADRSSSSSKGRVPLTRRSRQWMNVPHVHAPLCTWRGKAWVWKAAAADCLLPELDLQEQRNRSGPLQQSLLRPHSFRYERRWCAPYYSDFHESVH